MEQSYLYDRSQEDYYTDEYNGTVGMFGPEPQSKFYDSDNSSVDSNNKQYKYTSTPRKIAQARDSQDKYIEKSHKYSYVSSDSESESGFASRYVQNRENRKTRLNTLPKPNIREDRSTAYSYHTDEANTFAMSKPNIETGARHKKYQDSYYTALDSDKSVERTHVKEYENSTPEPMFVKPTHIQPTSHKYMLRRPTEGMHRQSINPVLRRDMLERRPLYENDRPDLSYPYLDQSIKTTEGYYRSPISEQRTQFFDRPPVIADPYNTRTKDHAFSRPRREPLLQTQYGIIPDHANDRLRRDYYDVVPTDGYEQTLSGAHQYGSVHPNAFTVKRKEKEPDTFDGKTVDWADYIVHFEQVAYWNQWDEREKAQQLSMCLRGVAQKTLSDLTIGLLSDYSALKNVLSQRFNPREIEIAHRCEFRNIKRQKDDTVADYGHRLRRLAQKAYPTLRYHEIEPTVIDQYIHGLNNYDLKKHVQFHHPQTLNQAIAFATEYEAFLGPIDKIGKPKDDQEAYTLQTLQPHTFENPRTSEERNILAQISNMIDAKFQEYFKEHRTISINRNESQGFAETSRNSGSANNTAWRNPPTPRQFDKPREIICFYCQEVGHIKSRCPYFRDRQGVLPESTLGQGDQSLNEKELSSRA